MLFPQADLKLFTMKLSTKFKINVFVVLVVLMQHMPFSFNIRPEYVPEVLSLIIYVMYFLNKDALGYLNLIWIALLNDIMNLGYVGISVVQYLIYAMYIDGLKKKYSTTNLLIEWVGFCTLNIVLLPCKYSFLNFIQNHDIVFSVILLKKMFVTIACFPVGYYLINKFAKNH